MKRKNFQEDVLINPWCILSIYVEKAEVGWTEIRFVQLTELSDL